MLLKNFDKETAKITATFILLLLYWCWAVAFIRSEEDVLPLTAVSFSWLAFDAEAIGQALKELFFYLLALVLLRETAWFKSLIAGSGQEQKCNIPLVLVLVLALSQIGVLCLIYGLALLEGEAEMRITNCVLLVTVCGLLGHWRSGLLLGMISALVCASYDLSFVEPEEWPQTWQEAALWHYLLNFEAMALITAGFAAGWLRDRLDDKVFSLTGLFLLGLCAEWLAPWMDMLVTSDSEDLTLHFSVALVTGFILSVFGLLVRHTLGDIARQRLAAAQGAKTKAELLSLRTQITPHFLFNSLTSILYFIRTDARTAYKLLSNLAEVFRSLLKSDEFVTLDDEVYLVKAYLELEQARLKDRLKVSWQLDDKLNMEQKIPALILQPIVENAVIHGISPNPDGGRVTIAITRQAGDIVFNITDTGNGGVEKTAKGTGIAYANIEKRLLALYGSSYQPAFEKMPDGGTRVSLKIPLSADFMRKTDMKILVVDDELGPRKELVFHLNSLYPEALVYEAENAEQTYKAMESHEFPVVFLDINLPGESGISIALKLSDLPQPPYIVFATAYDEYAVKAFELSALDYVVKPFTPWRMEKTVAKIRQAQGRQQALANQQQMIREFIDNSQADAAQSSLWVVQDNGNRKRLAFEDILYAQALDKRVELHCRENQVWDSSYTLKELEEKLPGDNFYRIHKSYLLNLDYVAELIPWFAGSYRVKLNQENVPELPVSRRQLAGLKKKLDWR